VPPAEPQDQESNEGLEVDLASYWRVIRKHLLLVLSVLLGTVTLITLWTLRQAKIYEATASVDIEQSTPQVLGSNVQEVVDSTPSNYWFAREYYETQYKVIASRAVAQRVVDKLGLATDLQFFGLDRSPDKEQVARALRSADPVALLQSRVRVDPVKDSHLVYIRVQDADPSRAALYANTVAQAFIDESADQRLETTRNAADWLQGQIGDLKSKLEGSELALYSFKRDNDILSMSLEDQQNTTSQKLRTVSDEITRIQTRKAGLAAGVKQIHLLQDQSTKKGEFANDEFGPVAQSPIVEKLKEVYFAQKQVVADLSQRYEAKHPKLVAAQEQLESAHRQLETEIEHIVGAAEADYRQAVDTEAALSQILAGVRHDAFEVNKKEIDYRKLEREATNNQRLYDLVLKRLKETDLSVLLRTNNVRLLDAAVVPKSPVKPNLRLNEVAALILGLLGGLGLAFGVERLDNTLKTQADIENVLGLSFLGVIPSISDASLPQGISENANSARDLFVHTHPKSSVAECCRSIRTNLLFMSPDRPLKRILVTSSGPQEGKTTTAISLGIAMAQSGSRTLLVDTDMRRPRLHRAFGIANEIGLSTAVVGEADLEACLKNTGIPNLWVLPCGPVPPNPAEMLHTSRFKEILAALVGRFDRIVLDSPPLAAVADAAVLATQVEGTLLVVKAGVTARPMALRSLSALSSVNAPVIGAILNDLDISSQAYGYYYYRNRGYYGQEGDNAVPG